MRGSEPSITARDLCKDFPVVQRHGSLKVLAVSTLKRLFSAGERAEVKIHRALDHVNFAVGAGESVAVIGRNGSGKSTLLSLIGRIYAPTSGELVVNGRAAPLLELGAGFHPDLTGAQNVEFNGVILGFRRKQVLERFDAIVAFAGLEDHIDEPIRNYSSGTVMRLGFAVACHTDAEILLVDEILSPADEEFQEKCYRRLAELQRQGRAILFVSHDMEAVRRVTQRAIWLDHGRVRADGPVGPVVDQYLAEARHVE